MTQNLMSSIFLMALQRLLKLTIKPLLRVYMALKGTATKGRVDIETFYQNLHHLKISPYI